SSLLDPVVTGDTTLEVKRIVNLGDIITAEPSNLAPFGDTQRVEPTLQHRSHTRNQFEIIGSAGWRDKQWRIAALFNHRIDGSRVGLGRNDCAALLGRSNRRLYGRLVHCLATIDFAAI